jgi:biopolymer transport protein ExbB/TolQ
METVILVTVLSTLGVVAMLTAIVVMAFKLRNKVDVNSFEDKVRTIYNEHDRRFSELESRTGNEIQHIHREFNEKLNNVNRELDMRVEEIHRHINNESEEIRRLIDSRLDKLDTKFVTSINYLKKELQQDEVLN